MKKSVIILIFLIYVASIAMVGFLGLKAKSYNDIIPVDEIVILNDCRTDPSTGDRTITFVPANENDKSIQLECIVLPDNATDKKIIYQLPSGFTKATIDENGLLTFNVDGLAYAPVRIFSSQNPTKSIEITVWRNPYATKP